MKQKILFLMTTKPVMPKTVILPNQSKSRLKLFFSLPNFASFLWLLIAHLWLPSTYTGRSSRLGQRMGPKNSTHMYIHSHGTPKSIHCYLHTTPPTIIVNKLGYSNKSLAYHSIMSLLNGILCRNDQRPYDFPSPHCNYWVWPINPLCVNIIEFSASLVMWISWFACARLIVVRNLMTK